MSESIEETQEIVAQEMLLHKTFSEKSNHGLVYLQGESAKVNLSISIDVRK